MIYPILYIDYSHGYLMKLKMVKNKEMLVKKWDFILIELFLDELS